MKTITIAHQKGGVGKTTLVLNLAHCFADSARVAITDTDLQGSINSLGKLVIRFNSCYLVDSWSSILGV